MSYRRLVGAFATLVLCPSVTAAQATPVDFGGLVLSVSTSRTAQVFHIVDQLSQWDQYAHKQYVRWAAKELTLDAADSAALKRHAELRRARGWSRGFEQAFLVDAPLDQAVREAVSSGFLRLEEAEAERAILARFMPKLAPLMDRREASLAAVAQQLQRDRSRLVPVMAQLRRFAERSDTTRVDVFLVANPDSATGGGEANGGRIVVEAPLWDAEGTLLHESLHFLLRPRDNLIHAWADSARVSQTMLNEGIAYALSPGITDDPLDRDRLSETAARFLSRGALATDAYVQSNMMALAIRPLLRAALASGETITQFMPKAVARWREQVGR
ncbi:MAG TPA: hypothetical protein VGI83_04000 [Gemmatimonadales bacterium]